MLSLVLYEVVTEGDAPTRNRTWNLLIKSQLLCQLSYRRVAEKHRQEPRLYQRLPYQRCVSRRLASDSLNGCGTPRSRVYRACNVS